MFPSVRRGVALVSVGVLAGGLALAVIQQPAGAASSGFAAGDVAVYRVGDGSAALGSASAKVFVDEYTPSGALVQSVALPTAVSGNNKPLTAGGSSNSEGDLTLSSDGRYLVATGYDAASGTASIAATKAASTPRTVGTISASDAIDTTTALTDFADQNNPRGAASTDGTKFWVAGAAGGVRYATLGASTSTALTDINTYKNFRQVSVVNGQLYASADPTKASVSVATIGTGLPTSGTQPVTNLPFSSAPSEPYAYSLLTLGAGTAPDTLYVADNTAGAIVKYVLSNGSWVTRGSVAVANVTGVTANDANGTVSIFATSSGGSGTAGSLYSITDTSGLGAAFSGAATLIHTAPTNEAYRGVAFAPGTVIGSGGGAPPANPPTITPSYSGLPAALGDPTNPTLGLTVADTTYAASQLTVTATSANTAVAPASGVSLSGTGATRTLTVTPAAVGYSTITLTVSAPDGTSATTTINYAVSDNQGDPSDRYFDGAGNLSTAIDVGNGYMLVGDDSSNVINLYNEANSSEPTQSFDFTSVLPFGTTSVDIEASTRIGNTIYWTGSMTNSSSGNAAPSRSTLFAATISGSGASTTLTYQGSYTGLLADIEAWDHNNGHGLGADYLGLTASGQPGIGSHESDAFDVEGMESAASGSTTAYLAFRAPLEPTTNRHLALVVPVTNLPSLTANGNPGTTHATFGAPLFWDLGGLGVREIRRNADGQYLIIAGTPDGTNNPFVLYTWDGNPQHPPLSTGINLPIIPSGANQGSWETIVNVPDPLASGTKVQLVEDNGNTAWYGDSATQKAGLAVPIQKDLGRTFSYIAAPLAGTTTSISANTTDSSIGDTITYTATVMPSVSGAPSGTVTFDDGQNAISGCTGKALDAHNSATCSVTYAHAAGHSITSIYSGDTTYATSTSTVLTESVHPTTLTITADNESIAYGNPDPTFTYTVGGLRSGDQLTTDPTCGVTGQHSAVGTYAIGCAGADAGPDYSINYLPGTLTVSKAAVTVTASADRNPVVTGQPVTFTATVTAATGSGVPSGQVEFSSGGVDLPGCSSVTLAAGTASCALSSGLVAGSEPVDVTYGGDTSFQAGASQAGLLIEQVNPASTSVSLSSDKAHPVTGQPVTFTAWVAVSAPGSTQPVALAGTVEFQSDGVTLAGCGSVAVDATGSATCTVTGGLTPTTHAILASYGQDPSYTASQSPEYDQAVAADSTSLTVSASNDNPPIGTKVTFTATVTAAAPGSGIPSGTVSFTTGAGPISGCGSVALTTATPTTATCAVTESALGAQDVTATYSGDPDFTASSGARRVQVRPGPPATLTLTPASSTINSGDYQAYTVTAKDAEGDDLGDVTASSTVTIAPDGTCSGAQCTAAIAGAHTVTATDGAATATATLSITAGSVVQASRDIVGVGDGLSQYGFDFFDDGSPGVAGGYNTTGNLGRVQSFSATGDADGRAFYNAPAGDGTSTSFDPSVILRGAIAPTVRPQDSGDGISALLADTGSYEQIQFVRSSRLPTPAEQQQAGALGWGGLHVVQYASDDIEIAVAASGTNAPGGLSPAELVKIYDGTYTTWGQLPGYSGPAPDSRIVALLPIAGSDTRVAFDADLAAANGGSAVQYLPGIQTVPDGDYTQILRQADPTDAIEPFSASSLRLLATGYMDQSGASAAPITALTVTAPDGAASLDVAQPLYVVLRDSDIADASPVPGASKNWAQLLFVGPSASIARSNYQTELVAAGLAPSYTDLADASS